METSIQEAVIDQFDDLLLSRACSAATLSSVKQSEAAISAVKDLSTILAVLSEPGLNAQISLGQALALMAAKGRIKGDRATKGLQNIILSQGRYNTLLRQYFISKYRHLVLILPRQKTQPTSHRWVDTRAAFGRSLQLSETSGVSRQRQHTADP